MSSPTQIHYCCVAAGNPYERVCSYPKKSSTHENTIITILQKVGRQDHIRELADKSTGSSIYYKVSKGVLFITVAGDQAKKRAVMTLLDDLEGRYHRGEIKSSSSKTLKERLDYYNDPSNDKLTQLHEKVDEVKQVIIEDIEKVLERGDKFEALVQDSDTLVQNAVQFNRGARTLKYNRLCLVISIVSIIIVVVLIIILVLILIIVAAVCGGLKNCKNKK